MKRFVVIIGVIILVLAAVSILIWLGYSQSWTGFQGYIDSTGGYHPTKTLWDWIELLILPVVLVAGVLLLVTAMLKSRREASDQRAATEAAIAEDRNREVALQACIDRIGEWMLERNLGVSETAQGVARARTLATWRRGPSLDRGDVRGIDVQCG